MGLEYLGLDAVGWHRMTTTWWDKVLWIPLPWENQNKSLVPCRFSDSRNV